MNRIRRWVIGIGEDLENPAMFGMFLVVALLMAPIILPPLLVFGGIGWLAQRALGLHKDDDE